MEVPIRIAGPPEVAGEHIDAARCAPSYDETGEALMADDPNADTLVVEELTKPPGEEEEPCGADASGGGGLLMVPPPQAALGVRMGDRTMEEAAAGG